ncbi:DUF805 domain-containing protein [Nisaea acidiphila]|uniref:DUF805 domain-containing protein n=1 Tax=Nisaea acidiphila TaxID=1862145 RepID=A0A9J7ANJ4_9PROT|nr:DUF805 domain-containing protein [Nisaea acidiphila]UUX48734.1 DUF805 domain-containing protein [Nisaea acidiphila]
MNFIEATSTCFKKYATFRGRARRSEYWYFFLALFIAGLIADALDTHFLKSVGLYGPFDAILTLVVILPSISVSVRRLHDINQSGYWLLILFVPIVGWVAYFFMTIQDGTIGPNPYGNDPKGREAPATMPTGES